MLLAERHPDHAYGRVRAGWEVGVGLSVGDFMVERWIVVETGIRKDLDDVQRLARRRIVAGTERRRAVKEESRPSRPQAAGVSPGVETVIARRRAITAGGTPGSPISSPRPRSEERRVGKECRS